MPFGVDDCVRYPLFTDDLIDVMRRLIPPARQADIAASVTVTASKPHGEHPLDDHRRDLIASSLNRNDVTVPTVSTDMSAPEPHATFDAGPRGCADGLGAELRRWWDELPKGSRCQVIVRDPAARADVPSVARMLGHTVEAERDDSGALVVIVRTKGA